MIEFEELKRLAELATPGPWRYGKNSDDVVADYPAGHEHDSHGIDYYGGNLVGESICSSNRAYIVAANPETVLELLNERSQLRQINAGQDRVIRESHRTTGDQRQAIQRLQAMVAKMEEVERELARVTAAAAELELNNKRLKDDLELLRKDADRYRWLRAGGAVVVTNDWYEGDTEELSVFFAKRDRYEDSIACIAGDDLDSRVDGAMERGECRSD